MDKKMKLTILVPAIFILLRIPMIYGGELIEGLVATSLLMAFPLVFLIQGIYSAKYKVNIFMGVGMSLISFAIFELIAIRQFIAYYFIVYIMAAALGYIITLAYQNISSRVKTKVGSI